MIVEVLAAEAEAVNDEALRGRLRPRTQSGQLSRFGSGRADTLSIRALMDWAQTLSPSRARAAVPNNDGAATAEDEARAFADDFEDAADDESLGVMLAHTALVG